MLLDHALCCTILRHQKDLKDNHIYKCFSFFILFFFAYYCDSLILRGYILSICPGHQNTLIIAQHLTFRYANIYNQGPENVFESWQHCCQVQRFIQQIDMKDFTAYSFTRSSQWNKNLVKKPGVFQFSYKEEKVGKTETLGWQHLSAAFIVIEIQCSFVQITFMDYII